MREYTCFVISPIGEEGTERYDEYKDLLDLIIIPALEVYNIKVSRGDHFISEDKIDASVIKNVQNADICICDVSEPNPNVYYELGRRDETGKPVLLLKRRGTPQCPVDIATRRFFEYDWEGRHAIRDAQQMIREFVEPLIEQGFEQTGQSATLSDIADSLSRLERKIDRLSEKRPAPSVVAEDVSGGDGVGDDLDPFTVFKFALLNKNIPLAERTMQQLQYRLDTLTYYDVVVEQIASMGSAKAGQMMINYAETFMDSNLSFKKKVEYLSALVGFLCRKDQEMEQRELVETLAERLLADSSGEDVKEVAQIHNQLNRLYYGLYSNTDDVSWLDKAIESLRRALALEESAYFYNNLAICLRAYGDATGEVQYYESARDSILRCLEMETSTGKTDVDHLAVAAKIFAKLNDPRLEDILARIQEINPMHAQVLRYDLSE